MGNVDTKPLISVIIPIYEVEEYLKKCVDSVLAQTYKNLEIILVDDGSPDNCPAICDEYAKKDSRIKVIHKENGGVSDARNAGLAIAKGEWLSFIDSDDWIADEYIERMFSNIQEADMVICGLTFFYEKDGSFKTHKVTDNDLLGLVYNSFFGYACNKMYRAKFIKELKFDKECIREDLVYNLSLFSRNQKFDFKTVDYEGYYYRQRKTSILHDEKPYNIIQACNFLSQVNKHIDLIEMDDSEKSKIYNKIIYTAVTDAVVRLKFKFSSIRQDINYIKQLFSAIPDDKLKKQYADNKFYKATYYAKKNNMVISYILFLIIIRK